MVSLLWPLVASTRQVHQCFVYEHNGFGIAFWISPWGLMGARAYFSNDATLDSSIASNIAREVETQTEPCTRWILSLIIKTLVLHVSNSMSWAEDQKVAYLQLHGQAGSFWRVTRFEKGTAQKRHSADMTRGRNQCPKIRTLTERYTEKRPVGLTINCNATTRYGCFCENEYVIEPFMWSFIK